MIKDPESRKLNRDLRNKRILNIRLSAEEKTHLQTMMEKDGWTNASGLVKNCLFGDDPEKRVTKMVQTGKKPDIAKLFYNLETEINDRIIYIQHHYEKDMHELVVSQVIESGEWTRKTNKWFSEFSKLFQERRNIINRIAKKLDIELDGIFFEEAEDYD